MTRMNDDQPVFVFFLLLLFALLYKLSFFLLFLITLYNYIALFIVLFHVFYVLCMNMKEKEKYSASKI